MLPLIKMDGWSLPIFQIFYSQNSVQCGWYIFVLAEVVDGASPTDRIKSTAVIFGHVFAYNSHLCWRGDKVAHKAIKEVISSNSFLWIEMKNEELVTVCKGGVIASSFLVTTVHCVATYLWFVNPILHQYEYCYLVKQIGFKTYFRTNIPIMTWECLLIMWGQDTTVNFYQSRPHKTLCSLHCRCLHWK